MTSFDMYIHEAPLQINAVLTRGVAKVHMHHFTCHLQLQCIGHVYTAYVNYLNFHMMRSSFAFVLPAQKLTMWFKYIANWWLGIIAMQFAPIACSTSRDLKVILLTYMHVRNGLLPDNPVHLQNLQTKSSAVHHASTSIWKHWNASQSSQTIETQV